jgi:hypothetical protein
VTSGSSSRCAFGRDTNNVPNLNSKTSAWIPPSAIKRDAFTTHNNHNSHNNNNNKTYNNYNNNNNSSNNTYSNNNNNNNHYRSNKPPPTQQYQQQQQQQQQLECSNDPQLLLQQIDLDDQETFRKVRGLLNKLTPEKFEKLSIEFCYLKIRNPKVLRGVIVLVS